MTQVIEATNASLRRTQAYSIHRFTLNFKLGLYIIVYIVLLKILYTRKIQSFLLGLN